MQAYRIQPDDVLFFRDARPMTAGEGSGGHGGRWPDPSDIFDALHRAFQETFPIAPEQKEIVHRDGIRFQRFGSLQTAGLFPRRQGANGGEWFFPCPADVTLAKVGMPARTLGLLKASEHGSCNLPHYPQDDTQERSSWLNYVPAATTPPSKTIPPAWWSRTAMEAYLGVKALPETAADHLLTLEAFAATEWTTGIGIDPETSMQDGEHIYSAEYLRLRPGVALGFAAAMRAEDRDRDSDGSIDLERLVREAPGVTVGGQRRVSRMTSEERPLHQLLPHSAEIKGDRVKWVLLTPAIFPAIECAPERNIKGHPGGWLPNWIDPKDGNVLLATALASKTRTYIYRNGKRRAKRDGASSPIPAKLVAARIPKPQVITGYSLREHLARRASDGVLNAGPRETLLAVPAGAVFYFEAQGATPEERQINAQALADALSWHGATRKADSIEHRRSTLWGEKGYGLGVCGPWEFYETNLETNRKSTTSQP